MPIADGKMIAANLPTLPGVYRFQNKKEQALYIGKAQNLRKRVSSYFQHKKQSPRIALMLRETDTLETIVTASEAEALLLENNLIKSLKPKYNILFRDDKSYPYLCLTRHPYARLVFYRGKTDDAAEYFGPFPDSQAVRETIDILQRVFRLRTCTDSVLATRTRPCLLHSIDRCSAPCVNKINPSSYAVDAAQAKYFLQGGSVTVEEDMQRRMEEAAQRQEFESAAVLRDRLRALAVVRSRHFADNSNDYQEADYIGIHHNGDSACVNIIMVRGGRRVGEKRLYPEHVNDSDENSVLESFLTQHYHQHPPPQKIITKALPKHWREIAPHLIEHIVEKPRTQEMQHVLAAQENARLALANYDRRRLKRYEHLSKLAKQLGLEKPPQRLECFDVSHSMGEETIAARVVFNNGAPLKSAYRLFRIKNNAAMDDYAAIHEAVYRCYKRVADKETVLPDALLIDGGAGQLTATLTAFKKLSLIPPPLFGVAKGASRKPGEETLITADGEAFQLPATDSALHLIQAVRDEAHRFAITAHRRRRDKKRSQSLLLDNIEGVGKDKRRLLINYFGGITALRAAGIKDLVKINGVGPVLAARIYRALH